MVLSSIPSGFATCEQEGAAPDWFERAWGDAMGAKRSQIQAGVYAPDQPLELMSTLVHEGEVLY